MQQLQFNDQWKIVYNKIDANKTEKQLYNEEKILCGTYLSTYTLEVKFVAASNYLCYKISEGSAHLKYGTVDNWNELISCVQLWINYIEKNTSTIYTKKLASEKIEHTVKVLVDGHLQDAIFAMYRNMDWEIEKFRGAYLRIRENNFAVINTFIGVENLLIDLQKSLPKNILLQSCMFCKYSHYNVAGNDNYGDLNCFKHCKAKCETVSNKSNVMDLFESESKQSIKVVETFYCEEYGSIGKSNFVYKSVINE